MKILAASLFIASSFFNPVSYAMDPPQWVYRIEMREPIVVFASGFITTGRDRDLLRFISGASLDDGSSSYIGTSQYISDAERICAEVAREHPDEPLYIYQIRPEENFYNVEESMLIQRDALPEGLARQQLNNAWLATRTWVYGMWAATAAIPGEVISGARRYNWNNGQPSLGPFIANNNYVYSIPEVSRRPMPVRNATVEVAAVAEDPHGVGFIPAAIVPEGCNAQPRRLRSSLTNPCLPISVLRSKTAAKMIVIDLFKSPTSGQSWIVPRHDEL